MPDEPKTQDTAALAGVETTPAVALPDTKAEQAVQHERTMFETYVQNQGEAIPEQYADAGAWFDGLKSSQAAYTKGQQEIAALKQQYNEDGTVNPDYKPPASEAPTTEEAAAPIVDPDMPKQLQVPDAPTAEETAAATDMAQAMAKVSASDWNTWGAEMMSQDGLSEATRGVIREKMNVTDDVINSYVAGEKAKAQVSYLQSADLIGGEAELQSTLKWASENLSPEERSSTNELLSGASYGTVLLGLKARKDRAVGTEQKNAEPLVTQKRENVTSATAGAQAVAYLNKQEFYADRNSPLYRTNTNFRAAVDQRVAITTHEGGGDMSAGFRENR